MKWKRKRILVVVGLIPLVLPATLLSDTLLTRDGRTFIGAVVAIDASSIAFRTIPAQGGTQIVFQKTMIRRITYNKTTEDQEKAAILQKQMAEYQKRLQEAQTLKEDQARMAEVARQQAEIKRVQEEQKKQSEELDKRKATVSTVDEQLAKLAEEEKKLDEQQKAIETRRHEIDEQKERIAGKPAGPTQISAMLRSALAPGWGQYLESVTYPPLFSRQYSSDLR